MWHSLLDILPSGGAAWDLVNDHDTVIFVFPFVPTLNRFIVLGWRIIVLWSLAKTIYMKTGKEMALAVESCLCRSFCYSRTGEKP